MIGSIASGFLLGLLTPLTAVCVLPLYPGFISYLANLLPHHEGKEKNFLTKLGLLVLAGVVTFMLLLGLLFTLVLQTSLTKVISIVSPIAFGVLTLISIVLIFDVNFSKITPHINTPTGKRPYGSAFLYGFFFGAIIIPCNPGFIAAFFTTSLATAGTFVTGMLSFLAFGLGIGAPLLLLTLLSRVASQKVIGFLIRRKTIINRIAGSIMLIVALYYLLYVFRIFG